MPSFSLLSSVASLFLSSLVVSADAHPYVKRTSVEYSLVESFTGSNFFDNFEFNTATDPTHGFVTYLGQSAAESAGLVNITSSGSVYLGVDSKTVLDPNNGTGRSSVRVQSKKSYTNGLFLADIQHMPQSACGIWPAFWSVGSNWPAGGEIDIIEGVNLATKNEMVLHTEGECTITNNAMTGNLTATQCSLTDGTSGCTIEGSDSSFGTGFNNVQGGVYAMEWTDGFIKIWFFQRDAIPQSIQNGQPDTSAFGTPMGNFQGSCNMTEEFAAQQLIFDTTFCGDWAGNVFGSSGCTLSNPSNVLDSCINYVALNPTAYEQAYWEINSIKIYQETTAAASSSTSVSSATTAATTKASTAAATTPTTSPVAVSSPKTRTHAASTTTPIVQATSSASATVSYISDCGGSQAESSGSPSSTPAVSPASSGSVTTRVSPTVTGTATAKETITTVIVTSYIDICPTGFTTKTITHTVTYCPADVTSGGPAPGFTTTVTLCTACAATPTSVTLTVPVTQVSATATPAPVSPASSAVTTTAKPTSSRAPVGSAGSHTRKHPSSSAGRPIVSPAPVVSPSSHSHGASGGTRTVGSIFVPSSILVTFQASSTTATPGSSSTSASAAVFTGAADKLTTSISAIVGSIVLALMI